MDYQNDGVEFLHLLTRLRQCSEIRVIFLNCHLGYREKHKEKKWCDVCVWQIVLIR